MIEKMKADEAQVEAEKKQQQEDMENGSKVANEMLIKTKKIEVAKCHTSCQSGKHPLTQGHAIAGLEDKVAELVALFDKHFGESNDDDDEEEEDHSEDNAELEVSPQP